MAEETTTGAHTPQLLLDQLTARRDELVKQKIAYLAQKEAQLKRVVEWQNKYNNTARRRKDPKDLEMVADAHAQAQVAEQQAAETQKKIDIVDAQIKKAEDDIQTYNAGLADATSKGLTGEAANIAATAHLEAAKATANTQKIIAYVIGGLVLLAGIVIAMRYLLKKKAK